MVNRTKIEREVSRFLCMAGLKHRPYSIQGYIDGLSQARLDVICEAFRPEGVLRAGVFRVGGSTIIFYPDPADVGCFAALQALAHEVGHLWLEHQLQDAHANASNEGCDPEQEEEAELFARLTIQLRAAVAEESQETSAGLRRYFGQMDKAGG